MAGPTLLALGAVFVGGGVGACCRYGISRMVARRYGGPFPLATCGINTTGSVLLGLALGAPLLRSGSDLGLLLLGTGVLGGYTTFSTAALETVLLARDGSTRQALVAWLGGTMVGLGGAALGLGLAALVWPGGSPA